MIFAPLLFLFSHKYTVEFSGGHMTCDTQQKECRRKYENLSSIKLDRKELCRNVKQCHSSYKLFLLFKKYFMFMWTHSIFNILENKLIIFFSVLTLNTVGVGRYNLHRQTLFMSSVFLRV